VKAFFKQFGSIFGAGVAAACCLGISVVLTAVGAVGLGFLVQDAYLLPIFVGFVGFSVWSLYRSARGHGQLAPFWLGLASAIISSIALFLMVTGLFPIHWLVYVSLAGLVASSIWDFVNGRKSASCATGNTCEVPAKSGAKPVDMNKRIMTGTALSAGAAVAFYGLYKSVDMLAPAAEAGEIACWGINECKETTDCTTAFNSCNGQNDCKGKGFLNVPEKECATRGGVPLKGSPADPANS